MELQLHGISFFLKLNDISIIRVDNVSQDMIFDLCD